MSKVPHFKLRATGVSEREDMIIRHSLGFESHYPRKSWGFRNYYCASPGHTNWDALVGLAERGLMVSSFQNGNGYFHVTKEGCDAVGLPKAAMRRAIPQPEKPVFLPLAGAHYDDFESGSKDHEFRLYGPRWNENTCRVGRQVTLSRGYGKHKRMTGVITSFERIPFNQAPEVARRIYVLWTGDIAKVGIKIIEGGAQ